MPVFPRKRFKKEIITGAPARTLGLAHESGWMTGLLFLQVIETFVQHMQALKSNEVLLIEDNHKSHVMSEVTSYAKDNRVIVLTIPSHCSDRLMSLDVAIHRVLKTYYNEACDRWMFCYPGEIISIYDTAALFSEAFVRGMTPNNILSAFMKTGIYKLNRNIFTEQDFMYSFITDQPDSNLALRLILALFQ